MARTSYDDCDEEYEICDRNVKNSLSPIKILDLYSPEKFSSGLYDFLRNRHSHAATKKISKDEGKSEKQKGRKITNGKNEIIISSKKRKTKSPSSDKSYGKKKLSKDEKLKAVNVHPALLSPKTKKRYKKSNFYNGQLRELSLSFNEN